jgi:hypothetical protein
MLKRSMLLSFVLCCAALPSTAAGGGVIEDGVATIGDGTVRMTFTARDGVCGDGDRSVSFCGTGYHTSRFHDDDDDWERECDEGPVRVSLKVRDGEVVRIRTRVGGVWHRAGDDVLDLGDVSPKDATDFLLDLVKNAKESVAEDAILPAILARDVVVWPRLMKIARNDDRPGDVRQSAVFWLGQLAGQKVTEGLVALVGDDAENMEVRETAVFALSQRHGSENTHHLARIARTNRHPQLRKQALFWLAQRDDPLVLDIFEEILLGK